MDVVADWSQRLARRVAPAELPLAAEVGRRYVAGGAERRRLYRADGEDTGGFGASIGASDLAMALDVVRQAGEALYGFLNSNFPANAIAIGTLVRAGLAHRRAPRAAPTAPPQPPAPAPTADAQVSKAGWQPLQQAEHDVQVSRPEPDGLAVALSDRGQHLLTDVLGSLALPLRRHGVPADRAEDVAGEILLELAADPGGAIELLRLLCPDLPGGAGRAGGRGLGPVAHPPWLWLYLVAALALQLPQNLTGLLDQLRTYRALPVGPLGGAAMLQLLLVAASLPVLFLLTGVLSVALPGRRGRRVEARHRLVPLDPEHEVHQFVRRVAPDVEVRVSADAGRLARVYPMSWRRARLGVFSPLLTLWHDDQPAARAALLHELAHVRQGEHLIIGLGSPFGRLLRVWSPVFVMSSLLPTAYLAVSGNLLAGPLGAQLLLDATAPVRILIYPVAAIWLAELAADAWVVESLGSPQPLLRALGRHVPGSWPSRAVRLLDHPPLRVRRWAAQTRPTLVLLLAWPATTMVKLALVIVVAIPAYALNGLAADLVPALVRGVHVALTSGVTLMAGSLVLLLGWPWLATRWPRPWQPGRPEDAPRRGRAVGRLSRRDYLKAATLPALLLVAGAWPSGRKPGNDPSTGTTSSAPALATQPGSATTTPATTRQVAPTTSPVARPTEAPTSGTRPAPVGLFSTARIVSFQQVGGRPEWAAAARVKAAAGQWTFGPDHGVSFTAPGIREDLDPAVGRLGPSGFTASARSSSSVGTAFTELTGTIATLRSGPDGRPTRVLVRFRWSSGSRLTATVNNQTFDSTTQADYDVVAELALTR